MVFNHVLKSMVFMMILIGVLLCIQEFMDDKFIAHFVLVLLWSSEIFMFVL